MADERSEILCQALEGAGYPEAAVNVARIAKSKGFAPSTTHAILNGIDPGAARVAASLYGDAITAPVEPVAGGNEPQPPTLAQAREALNRDVRAAAGIPYPDEAA